MKTNTLKYAISGGIVLVIAACSTKKDNIVSRNWHALNTEYNTLYNGGIALETGVNELKSQYVDNFWEILPVERMQSAEETMLPGEQKNPNFERAETKAIKAIQKHSMNIDGSERNPQMDEAHLMLGMSRYYERRYVPALEAFNYVLYKYPKSDKIHLAKIWREKTNMRMENDFLAAKNLTELLKHIELKDQVYADANATLAQAFLNLKEQDSAVAKLKLAAEYTKENEEKARYHFILGQLYDEVQQKDSANLEYQQVIDMKRKSPRRYVIQAHAKQAQYFDFKNGDTLAFMEKYNDLLEDRENRPYLDVLNHQVGLFYNKLEKDSLAKVYYNRSLRTNSRDNYLVASNYRNIAEINFNDAKYAVAGKYYDSTLVRMDQRTREYRAVKKKRENLEDVIKYEAIAQNNDSILRVVSLSEPNRIAFFEEVIARLKKEEEARKKREEAAAQQSITNANSINTANEMVAAENQKMQSKMQARSSMVDAAAQTLEKPTGPTPPGPTSGGTSVQTNFYFYNPTTVAFGKNEFRKRWGNRSLKDNWRLSEMRTKIGFGDDYEEEVASNEGERGEVEEVIDPRFTVDYYLTKIPTEQKEIDSLAKDRNFAYYQLGLIYKEKFKEYELAAGRLEKLLDYQPEERLVLPAKYNLYKIYEILNNGKAPAIKQNIISQHPDSRYATILKANAGDATSMETPETAYNKLFRMYESGKYVEVLKESDELIDLYSGEEIVPKIELLKANTIGKLRGIEQYKGALNYVALNYPNNPEGKQAEELLQKNIPQLEAVQFYKEIAISWKIMFKTGNNPEEAAVKKLQEKLKKFVTERTSERLTTSFDVYTSTENFVVVHGFKTEQNAKDAASILKDFKDYKITEVPIIISNENYKVIQIKKNLPEYQVAKKP